MTIWKKAITLGTWHTDNGQIKDEDGNVLATYPCTDENQIYKNNAELMAAAPKLLEVAKLSIELLAGMTTEQFAEGAANPVRQALVDAIKPFVRQTDSNGFQWSPEYDYFMMWMFGTSDEELHKHFPNDEEFAKYKAYAGSMDAKHNLSEKKGD